MFISLAFVAPPWEQWPRQCAIVAILVTGQDDNVYPPMSTFLEEKGIAITQGFRAEDIPGADLVVIGNAMTRGNPASKRFSTESFTTSHYRRSLRSSFFVVATTWS